jgi:hypothetical protein
MNTPSCLSLETLDPVLDVAPHSAEGNRISTNAHYSQGSAASCLAGDRSEAQEEGAATRWRNDGLDPSLRFSWSDFGLRQ